MCATLILDNMEYATNTAAQTAYVSNGGSSGAAYPLVPAVAHYKMNDSTHTHTVVDETGNYNGTATFYADANTAAGRINTALSFNGTSDYVTISSLSGLVSNFSLSFWIKQTSVGAYEEIFHQGSLTQNGIAVYSDPSGHIYTDDSGGTSALTTSATISAGVWAHIVVVQGNGTRTIYINNGTPATGSAINFASATGNVVLGANTNYGSPIQLLGGSLDDVRIYNYALTASDVALLYNAGNGTESDTFIDLSDSLVAHYKMNDNNAGYTVIDNIGGLHGTSAAHTTTAMSVTGKINSALKFNGTSDDIHLPHAAFDTLLDGMHPFSISMWYKQTTDATGVHLLTKGPSDANGMLRILSYGDSNGMSLWLWRGTDANTMYIRYDIAGFINADGNWHQIVWTSSGSGLASGQVFYFDSVAKTPTVILDNFHQAITNTSDVVLGGYNDSVEWLSGAVDDVRIYSKALSPAEVATIYNSTNGTEADENNNLGDGLVGHWKMNDNAADYNVAENIKGLTGTSYRTTATVHTTGVVNGALSFNGSTDIVSIPASTDLNFGANDFTIGMWVNPTSVSASYIGLFNSGSPAGSGTYNCVFYGKHAGYNSAPYVDFDSVHKIVTTATMGTGWHYFVVERNGNTGSLYMDDMTTAIGTVDLTGVTLPSPTNGAVIGHDGYVVSHSLTGNVDDFRLYNKALTVQERLTLYGLGNGLVAHYKCNDTNGTTLVDNIGSRNGTGTYTSVAGKVGGAAGFNGSTDVVVVPYNSALYPLPISITGWFYLTATPGTNYQMVLSGGGGLYGYEIRFDSGSATTFNAYLFPDTGYFLTNVTQTYSLNTWYHFAITYDGSDSKLYINAGTPGTSHKVGSSLTNGSANVGIGARAAGSYPFPGNVDDVRIYNKTLTANEVAEIYNAGLGTESDNTGTENDGISSTTPASLVVYSEGTIKTQGSYSLKGIALMTTSAGKTLTNTPTVNSDLTGVNNLRFDIRASRTGSNIKIGIHDSGGTTTEITPNVLVADTFQTVVWDISGVSDANKDNINSIIVTIVDATADNTFYLDFFGISQGSQIIDVFGIIN